MSCSMHGRDVLGLRLDRKAEDELLDDAAGTHTCRLTGEVQRHLGRDRDVGADADEVDMDEIAARRVALHLAGERQRLVAVDLQGDQGVGATGEDVGELTGGHGDRLGVAPEAVDDRRHAPGATQPSCGARAALDPLLGEENRVFGHDELPTS